MKVVVFINTSWNIFNFRVGLVRALQKSGYEVHAVAPEDAYSVHLTAMGCVYHPIKMNNTGGNPLADLGLIYRIYKIFYKINPQIILNYTIKPNIYGALVANWLGKPSICNVSGLGTVFLTEGKTNTIARYLYRLALKYPSRVFFQNQSDLDLFIDRGLLFAKNYQLIAGSGVDIRRFSPESNNPKKPPFVFLMMARLIEEKGVKEFLAAARILQTQGYDVKCQLLGQPEQNHKRGIPPQEIKLSVVDYLGETSDVREFISNAHAIVLPSYREGLAKSILEAAAMSKPIIASDVPGCREVVKDQINGLLCKPRNVEDLAEKMRVMLALSEDQLNKMGEAGRKLVV